MEHIADFSIGSVVKVHSNQLEDFKKQAQKNEKKKVSIMSSGLTGKSIT